MSGGPQSHAATLVVRAWREPDGEQSLRVRVVEIPLPPASEHTICVTTSVEEASAVVREWIEQR